MSATRRTTVAAGIAAALLATTVPAAADPAPATLSESAKDWGDIVKSDSCVQSHAWFMRVDAAGGIVKGTMFEAHFPETPKAPKSKGGGDHLVNLTLPPGIGIGVIQAVNSRALGNELPANAGSTSVEPAPCHAFAEAQAGSADVGVPYVANPKSGGTQLSPFGVHADGMHASATSAPGKPVALRGTPGSGYISLFGNKVFDMPETAPRGFGVRIPEDYGQPAFAQAVLNEQITTDGNGHPTVNAKGNYFYDETATSGFVNGFHTSVLGGMAVDFTISHAAVLQRSKVGLPECAAGARCAKPGA